MLRKLDISHILPKVNFFSDIIKENSHWEKLAGLMRLKQFQKGEKLISQGAVGDEFFILVEGEVSVYRDTIEGSMFKVAQLQADNYPTFGEGGLIEGEVRSATIGCDRNCVCIILERTNFNKLCEELPLLGIPIYKKISQILIKRLNQTNNDLLMLHRALMDEIRG